MSCGWAKLLCCLLLLTCKSRERAGAGGWLLAMLLFACAGMCVSCVAHSADGERRRGWAADVLDMVSSSAWRVAPRRSILIVWGRDRCLAGELLDPNARRNGTTHSFCAVPA